MGLEIIYLDLPYGTYRLLKCYLEYIYTMYLFSNVFILYLYCIKRKLLYLLYLILPFCCNCNFIMQTYLFIHVFT